MTETTMTTAPVKESSMKKKEPRFILSPSSCSSHSGTNRARVSNVRWLGRHTSEEPGLAFGHWSKLRRMRSRLRSHVLTALALTDVGLAELGIQRKSLKDRGQGRNRTAVHVRRTLIVQRCHLSCHCHEPKGAQCFLELRRYCGFDKANVTV